MAKVYDCFPFFNELDILKIRLREMSEFVDHFVLVEASRTHTGHSKPFYFKDNKDLFVPYLDKIVNISIDLPEAGQEAWHNWGRENLQRAAILDVLDSRNLSEDDIIVTSDVDEIVRGKVFGEYKIRQLDLCCIEQKTYNYNLNCVLETATLDPKICKYKIFKEVGPVNLRYYQQSVSLPVIKNGGWHLSFMGGTDQIIEKMKAYAHYNKSDPSMSTYMSRENIEDSVRSAKSLFMREDIQYSRVPDPQDLPLYVKENMPYFISQGWVN